MRSRNHLLLTIITMLLLAIAGCSESPQTGRDGNTTRQAETERLPVYQRWYKREQTELGGLLFQQHCAVCHKADASGTPNWKETDAAGKLPPPPLNGTAHTWHHSLPVLRRVVTLGGARLGGTMPAFGGKLSSDEIDAVLAWVQSHWPDRIYAIWNERNSQ